MDQNPTIRSITVDELTRLIRAGGWHKLTRGNNDIAVTDITMLDGGFSFMFPGEITENFSTDRLQIRCMKDGELDGKIEIRGPKSMHEQRKRAEGGGWHFVDRMVVKAVLIHPQNIATVNLRRAEEYARYQAEQEARRQREARIAAQKRDARVSAFLNSQKEKIGDATVVGLDSEDGNLTITFSNSHKLMLWCFKDDPFDIDADPELVVETSDDKMNLSTGYEPQY